MKFKANLRETLDHLIHKQPDSILMVDDLITKLQSRFPGVTGLERANILTAISRLHGKKVEYMGKKKK